MKSLTDVTGRSIHRPPARGPVQAWLALAVLAVLAAFAGSSAATDQGPPEREPRFHIESVTVEGVRRASPEVIASESLLAEGIAYTEAELREAVYRVGRLPFVLDADFALAKGSERGRYSLLITVEEVRGFFFGSDLGYAAYGGALEGVSLDDEPTAALSAGMRVFAGQGVFFAAVGDEEDLQVGYERYRLLDRPVLLRFAYAREGCCATGLQELGLDPAAAVWTAADDSDRLELTIGVPLGGNHSLRFDATAVDTASAARRPLDGSGDVPFARLRRGETEVHDVKQRELELAWIFDSTDDPVFPTRGDALTAAVGLRWLEGDLSNGVPLENGLPASGTMEMSSQLVGLTFLGARHWPLSARQTVSLSLKLLLSRSEVDGLPLAPVPGDVPLAPVPGDLPLTPAEDANPAELRLWNGDVDALEADLGARYSLALWGQGKVRELGELRWETIARLIYVETSPAVSPSVHPLWGVSLSTGVALRNSWGLFRIGFTFLDYDGVL